MAKAVSTNEFHSMTRGLIGMPLSHAWRGYSTAIFLEFGELNYSESNDRKGEATAMIEWDWRVEKQKSILFGSGSGKRKIANGLQTLIGRKIVDVNLEGRLPELIIALSHGLWIHTFAIYEAHPEWTLFLPNRSCLSSRLGRIEMEPCDKITTP